jgi:transposase
MFDINDDTKGAFRRVEVLTGSVRRRRWSDDQKARIVGETLVPGARVSEVARRWQLSSQQVFGWRRAARRDLKTVSAMPAGSLRADFVPIVTDTNPVTPAAHATASVIEIRLAGAVVRVTSGMNDTTQLTAVLRAVRASASRS